MRTVDLITKKLTEAFTPQSLEVLDKSHQHEGHAGHRLGGQTHFRIYIVSNAFKGKTRLERHRMINQSLAAELTDSIHALAIHATAPGEGESRSHALAACVRGKGCIRNAVIRLRARRSTLKRNP